VILRSKISAVTSHPFVYEFQRWLLGSRKLDDHLQPAIRDVCVGTESGVVVDVGGGTARGRSLWPSTWRYYSVDPDDRKPPPMTGITPQVHLERLFGSADSLPFEESFADVVLMKDTSHHLDDETWLKSLNEIERVLKPGGYFIFLDALLNDDRWISIWFWKLDNGKWPRRNPVLTKDISNVFEIINTDTFSLIHDVMLIIGKSRSK
jgi:SAM-dependent methyltransferase